MSQSTVVIVHGAYGNPDENWFPWLASKLERLGIQTHRPLLPTPEGQSLQSWESAFHDQVGPIQSHMVLVGHSLGPALILRLLEGARQPVKGVCLASAFLGLLDNPDFDIINASFFAKPFAWDRIRANAGRAFLYQGSNDPYVPLLKGAEVAEQLGVNLTVIPHGGHLNASAGLAAFPQLLADVATLCGVAS